MKALAPVRAALGVRTIFNLLGPLANPAQVPYAVIGAWSLEVAELMAETLAGMAIARVFVVHGDSGWDEPTPAAPFTLFDVRPGAVEVSRRSAADFGLPACGEEGLIGGDARVNARRLEAVLRGREHGGHRDALVMGAALVAEVTGAVPDAARARARARRDRRRPRGAPARRHRAVAAQGHERLSRRDGALEPRAGPDASMREPIAAAASARWRRRLRRRCG